MANLEEADLKGTDFGHAGSATEGLEPDQEKRAENWKLAYYEDDFLAKLGLPPDHNYTLPQKLDKLADARPGILGWLCTGQPSHGSLPSGLYAP